MTDQGGAGPRQAGAASRTAAKTAAKSAGKRGLLGLGMRGAGALAGGPLGIGLLALSVLPSLFSSGRLSKQDREKAIESLLLQQRARSLAAQGSSGSMDKLTESIRNRDLDRNLALADQRMSEKPISPELASLLGESQERLAQVNQNLGGSDRLSLDQIIAGSRR